MIIIVPCCPKCGSTKLSKDEWWVEGKPIGVICLHCGKKWEVPPPPPPVAYTTDGVQP